MSAKFLAVLACGTFLGLNSFADSWDKKTFLTRRRADCDTREDAAAR